MSERLGLLHAIRDNPDDDGPRLIFADWLEDHGDSDRADFIRVQIERARLADEDDRQAELEARERRLLLKHADGWVPAELPLSWTRFRRGMPEVLAPESSSWLTDEQIDSLGPLPIRELWLSGGGEEVDTGRIREMEFMERLEGLRLHNRFGGADLRDLLSSQWLQQLRWLDLSGADLSDHDVGRILALPAVDGIERLTLGTQPFGASAVSALAAKPWPNLRELTVRATPETTGSVATLMTFELWRRATISLLAMREAASHLAEALCQTATWGGLRGLHLETAHLADDLLERLLRHPAAAGLRQLSLVNPLLDSAQFARLADAANLANLADLSLFPPAPILGPLARSRYLTRLVRIVGWGEDADVIDFVNSPNADHVRLLCPATLSDRVAHAVATSPHLARLTTLQGNARLTDAAAEALAGSPHLKCLTRIDLDTSQLSAHGQQVLLEAEHLGWVGLRENQLKSAHLRRLWQQRYGDGERLRVLSDGYRERL